MTDGEKAIWAAAFVRGLLDKAKPSDHAMSSHAAYADWQREIALHAAGLATDVLSYAQRALDTLVHAGDEVSPVALHLRAMLGWRVEVQKEPSGDAGL